MKESQVKKGRFKFEPCFEFPKEVSEFIPEIMQKLGTPEKSYCHVCCGKSKIGGLRVDKEASVEPDLVADILDLPDILGMNSQANILNDMPWVIPYGKRRYFMYALRDICKVGGYLIINAPFDPWVVGLELVPPVWKVRQAFNSYRDLVDFWIFRKTHDVHDVKPKELKN